jgi:hypothetical protein
LRTVFLPTPTFQEYGHQPSGSDHETARLHSLYLKESQPASQVNQPITTFFRKEISVMFSTPTSKAGSLFDLMRSSPSPAPSSSYQECHDHSSRTARSGAPSLQSKSPASIASFNSGSRYQPSSCSTYSASALPGSGLSRNIFKKQYIHQAIRLVDDALMEQEKGSSCDESYACQFLVYDKL